MGEGIIIPAVLDATGFTRGTKQLESAVKSLSNRVRTISNNTQKMASSMINPLKRIIPMLLGVGSAYGIISKAVSAFMSQNQQLSAQMSSIWTALGNLLGPIITKIINWVSTALSYFLSFLKLLGVTSKTASQLSKSASGAANQLQKTLAGFDELNVLQDNKNSGMGGATLKDVDPSEWMKKLADLLKNKLWDDAADLIIEKMNGLIATFKKKAEEFGTKASEYFYGISHIVARAINGIDWKGIGEGIAGFINGLFSDERIDGKDLGAILVGKFTIAFRILMGFLEMLNGGRLGEIFSGIIIGAFESLTKALRDADPQKIGNNIRAFFQSIDWKGIGEAIFGFLKEAWNFAWDLFLGLLGAGTENESPIVAQLVAIKNAAEDCARAFVDAMGPVWEDIIKPLLEWTGRSVIPEILKEIADGFNVLTVNLKLFRGLWVGAKELLFGDSQKGFEQLKKATDDYNKSMSETETPLESFLKWIGISIPTSKDFASQMKSSGEQIKTAFSGMAQSAREKLQSMKESATTNFNNIRSAISTGISNARTSVTQGFSNMVSSIRTSLSNIRSNIGSAFSSIISAARSWGRDLIQNFINGLGDRIDSLWNSMRNIAQGIRDFLGFSEPKKGPLSDFHTYAPDMMKLYASGIKSNEGEVFSAVNDVANAISGAFDGGSIPMPAVAGGGFLPYGVGSMEYSGTSGGEVNSEILAAVLQLQELIVQFENAVDNMKWEARFGNVRALVEEVTRIQKQTDRSRGG